MITLYHSPQTRSGSIVWLLEELEVPYQTKVVGFSQGRRHRLARSRESASPWQGAGVGRRRGDFVFEGSAIALYLTDKYRTKKARPRSGRAEARRVPRPGWLTGPASWSRR